MRLLPFVVTVAALLGFDTAVAQNSTSSRTRLSAEEVRQGFRNHVVLAKPRPAAQSAALAQAERDEGRKVRRSFSALENLRVLELTPDEAVPDAIARLQATGRYEYVEPDYIQKPHALPDDPRFMAGDQWYLNNTGLNGGTTGADIGSSTAWKKRTSAAEIIVAIIDTGLRFTHEDLSSNLWTNSGEIPANGIDDDHNGYVDDVHGINSLVALGAPASGDPSDDFGHGTRIASLIGATTNNGRGISGVAWRVRLMPLKFDDAEGSATASNAIECIDYALAHGASVINYSYGTPYFSQAKFDAIKRARDDGVIIVASAGNDFASNDLFPIYPANDLLDNIVAVTSTNQRDWISNFSNYSAGLIELAAPGTAILSADNQADDSYSSSDGTSFSAPLVAGTLALLKAEFPNDTYRGLINRLLRGTVPLTSLSGFTQTGGRLDLARALNSTSNRPFNDDFGSRPLLLGPSVTVRSHSGDASVEAGEPSHASLTPRATLWWTWTANSTGTVAIETNGSGVDTILAVYTGTSLSALTAMASNDDAPGNTTSRVSFRAVSGTSYQIAVGSKTDATGSILLTIGYQPSNDDFAGATPLSGPSLRVTGFNTVAGIESDEPKPIATQHQRTVWYKWTAPSSTYCSLAVHTSGFDAVGAMYSGNALGNLALLATFSTKPFNEPANTSVTAGTTYYIQIDSADNATGYFILNVSDDFTLPFYGAVDSSPTFSPPTGYLLVGDRYGGLAYINFAKPETRGALLPGTLDVQTAACDAEGRFYLGDESGHLNAYAGDLSLRWQKNLGAVEITSSPGISVDGAVHVHTDDGFLHSFFTDGTPKWRAIVPGESYSSPAFGSDGTVYIGSDDQHLYALSPTDGTLKWRFRTDGEIYASVAIGTDGTLYFGTLNGKFYAVSPAGEKRWEFAAGDSISSSAAIDTNGNVYFGCYDTNLYSLTGTGALRWKYPTGDEIRASSPLVADDGTVYIGSYDGYLHAVTASGTLSRVYATSAYIRSSPLLQDHMLMLGGGDAYLHIAVVDAAAAANSPWPMHRQNVRRNGHAAGSYTPSILAQPASQNIASGSRATLSVTVSGGEPLTFQWYFNGTAITGATHSQLSLPNVAAAQAGDYSVVVSGGYVNVTSTIAKLTVSSREKVTGSGREVGSNIFVASNGNTFDQVLLDGASATITADHEFNQITRISYVDLDEDIVQVEMSGPGSLALTLENSSGPALAGNYNQSTLYMKGQASIVITGADERTNLSVFSVGRRTAVNQALFRDDVTYGGIADLAKVAIASTNGRFGGIRMANARFSGAQGPVGIVAPGIAFDGPVFLENINASGTATPSLLLGRATDVRITGGNLLQDNGRAVHVSGLSRLKFTAGGDSHGKLLPAQPNRAALEDDGQDVTALIVVNPTP